MITIKKNSLFILQLYFIFVLCGCGSASKKTTPITLQQVEGMIKAEPSLKLPYDAQISVRLERLNEQQGDPIILSRQRYQGIQMPIFFSLGYSPDEVYPNGRYQISAIVKVKGKIVQQSKLSYNLVTTGQARQAVITLRPSR